MVGSGGPNNDLGPSEDHERMEAMKDNGIFGGIYGMAFVGAAIYFIQNATTFWSGAFGFFKAVFWPAVLMYKLLEAIKM
jgi:hypothetical protein